MGDPLVQRMARAVANRKGLKLVALLLALVSWFVIHASISHERLVRDIPVIIRTDEGWAVLHAAVKSVNILFRGSQEDLRVLDQSPVRVEVDARKGKEGLQHVRLTAGYVQAAGMARPVFIDPPNLSFVLDQQGEKLVSVMADFQGNPVEEFEKTQVVCEPAAVMLHGPRQELAELDAVHTAPIDLEGRSRPFRKTHVPLVLPPDTWLANGTASNSTVNVTIAERVATRMFQDVPVTALIATGTGGQITLDPARVNLTLRSRAEVLGSLKREDLHAYVDGAALAPGVEVVLPVRVFTPAGLEVAAIAPANIKVRLKH